jgi:serine protein kinase
VLKLKNCTASTLKAIFVRSVAIALEKTYGGRHEDVKVHRVAFSEKERVGIGTFSPSDPKSQDITELTGSIDLSTIGEVGVESGSARLSFRRRVEHRQPWLDGIRRDVEGRREVSLQPADAFAGTEHQDRALRDDLRGRSHPFAFQRERVHRVSPEIEIGSAPGPHHPRQSSLQPPRLAGGEGFYDKLLHQSEALRNVHLAPNTLKVAAMFAVMTRLEEPKRQNVDIVKKMKLYDGEDVEGYKSKTCAS